MGRTRALLAGLIVFAGLTAPHGALGANGDSMHVGESHTATASTSIETTGTHAFVASTDAGDAVRAISSGPNASGVFGSTASPTGFGVFAYNAVNLGRAALGAPQAALWARQFGAPLALKVEGSAEFQGEASFIQGNSSSALQVQGKADFAGAALFTQSGAEPALQVNGKAALSRSGTASVPGRRSWVDVDLSAGGGLAGMPLCFANLTTYRSGIYVAAVRPNFPSTDKLRIYLNKRVASPIAVAWMVLN